MATLTRELLNQRRERRVAEYPIVDGITARLQSINGVEKSEYEAIVYDAKGDFQTSRMGMRRPKLIQLCLIDDAGRRVYKPEDLAEIQGLDAEILAPLFAACVKHTGIDREPGVAAAKKNSAETSDSATPSESASSSESPTRSPGSIMPTPGL